jgi:ABC-type antimicrobial peptide transport system permease subunit
MFRNYLKVAIRNLIRERSYSLINVMGLSVGLGVSLLILLWVQSELKIDGFHKDGQHIYRVMANVNTGESGIVTWQSTPYPLMDYLIQRYPDFEAVAAYDLTNKRQIEFDNVKFLEDGIYATSSFFDMLSFPMLEGEASTAQNKTNSITISEHLATKLFGKNWQGKAVGHPISLNGEKGYTITGVFASPPEHSSLQFDYVLSLEEKMANNKIEFPWGNFDSKILIKAREGLEKAEIESRLTAALRANNEFLEKTSAIVQPFSRGYLHGKFEEGKEAGGRIMYVRLFAAAAIFLLLIACMNFMNLATARASRRAREVGVRKAVGAGRSALISQFLFEAGLITTISLLFALALGSLALPYFQHISGKNLAFQFSSPFFWGLLAGIGAITTLLAGSYPAFFLSSFKITNILKGRLAYNFAGNHLRKLLVVIQFVLSALLIVGALGVQQQIDYIKNKHLGLDKQNVMYFRMPPGAQQKPDAFKAELTRIPGIEQLTFTSSNPLEVSSQTADPSWEGMPAGAEVLFNVMQADHQFLKTMNIPLAEGRNFSEILDKDTVTFLINETAAAAMKLEQPLGKKIEFWGMGGSIVGIVKNFHINSLYESIGPLIIIHAPENTDLAMLRINPALTSSVISEAGEVFSQFSAGYPFRYDFMDERFLQKYQSEQRTGQLSRWFAIVALFVSCLGLLGLTAFTAELRQKEISIRKILGATSTNVVALLSRDFIRLVGLALMIALPLGWYLLRKWLSDFEYHINLSWDIFALAGGIAIAIAMLTVSLQSLKAVRANPADSLKQE